MLTTNTDSARQLPTKIADYKFDLDHSAETDPNHPNQITLKISTGEKLTLAFPKDTEFKVGSSLTTKNIREAFDALVSANTIDGLGLQKRSFAKALENLCEKYGAVEFLSQQPSAVTEFSLSKADLPSVSRDGTPAANQPNPDNSAASNKTTAATATDESSASKAVSASGHSKASDLATLLKNKFQSLKARIAENVKSFANQSPTISRLVPRLSALGAAAALFILATKNFNKETDPSESKGNNTPVPEQISSQLASKKTAAESECPVNITPLATNNSVRTTKSANPFLSAYELPNLSLLSPIKGNGTISEFFDMSSQAQSSASDTAKSRQEVQQNMTDMSFSDFRKLSYYIGVGNNSKKNGHKEYNKADQAARDLLGTSLSEAIKLHRDNPNITFSVPQVCKDFLSEVLSSKHARAEISSRVKALKEALSAGSNQPSVENSTVEIPAEKKGAAVEPQASVQKDNLPTIPAQDNLKTKEADSTENLEQQNQSPDKTKAYNPGDNLPDQTNELQEVAAPYDLIKLFAKLGTNNNPTLGSRPIYHIAGIFDVSTSEVEAIIAHRNNKDNVLVEVSSGLYSLIDKMNQGASQQELRKAYDELDAQKIDWSKVDSMARKPQANRQNQSTRTSAGRRNSSTEQQSERGGSAGGYDYKTESRSFEVLGGRLLDNTTATTEYAGETFTSRGLKVGPVRLFEQGDGYFKFLGIGNNPKDIPARISREEVLTSFEPMETMTANEMTRSARGNNK